MPQEVESYDRKTLDLVEGISIKTQEDGIGREVIVVRCSGKVIGMIIAKHTKYITSTDVASYEFLSLSTNPIIHELLEDGIRVTPSQMEVYVEHYLQGT